MKTIGLSTLFYLFFIPVSWSQQLNQRPNELKIKRTTEKIKLDGILDELSWIASDSAYDFYQNFPSDTSLAIAQTTVYILYDDENIYVSAKMYRPPTANKYITPSLRRDFRGESNDSFSVVFDTFQDKINGTLFGINPFGVRREGLITSGGNARNSYSLDWDNKWQGMARIDDDCWVAEMAIPFNTLRYNEGEKEWNLNFYRVDSHFAEKSTWAPIPRNLSIISMATFQKLIWDQPTSKKGANISIIPYASAGTNKDYLNNLDAQNNNGIGFDLKYGISSGLNLDLTVNPDFSQVEVDEQVTNLDRFEIFFPEKRQFFLENADLFGNSGNRTTRPFFSRRIGIASDPSTGLTVQNQIPFGLRLSGKVSQNTRVGLLNMQGASDKDIEQPGINYTVATMQQKIFNRSNLGFILVNKQPFKLDLGDSISQQASNQTAGIDFNLLSADNKWSGNLFSHHSFDKQQPDEAYAMGMSLNYNIQNWKWDLSSQRIGAGYNPEVGYVRRTDIFQASSTIQYSFFPLSSLIQSHGPGFDIDLITRSGIGFIDWDTNLMYKIKHKSSASFDIRLRRQFTHLTDDFDPSGTDGLALKSDEEFTYNFIIASFVSDARKKLFFTIKTNSGNYFNGSRINLNSSVGIRYQPFGATSLDVTYNNIKLPRPYSSSQLYLIGPKFDFTFTKKLFWTTYVQYNSQIENLNINSRIQWRFKPVSDIYLVYTDNYFAYNDDSSIFEIGRVKSRALTFKITYWLNL